VRKFQKVVDFSFVDDKQLVLSGVQNGQSDIYLYTIASTTTRKITDDYYDDRHAAYIKSDSIRGIMFSSNREDETLTQQRYESQVMQKQFDIFFYDLDGNSNRLYRISSTPYANESYPQNLNDS
jgi:Tol biopolymer transport system component